MIDPTMLDENGSGQLIVKLVAAGGIEASASGIQVKALGITNDMLAGSIPLSKLADGTHITLDNVAETITSQWTFPVANIPMIGTEHITTKEYVDALLQGLQPKEACRALGTTNRDVSSGLPTTVDGVTGWADGDRILLNGQTDPIENGVWEVQTTGGWTRPLDFSTGDSVGSAYTFVQEGTIYADTGWVCTNNEGTDIVGTDDLDFAQFSSAGVILPGDGLEKVGNTLNVLPAQLVKGGNAEIDGDLLQVSFTPTYYNPVITAPGTTTDQLIAHLKGIDNALSTVGESQVDKFTLIAADITAEYVTLTGVPKSASRVTLTVAGGPSQDYGTDYTMSIANPDQLTWTSLGLAGKLEIGDRLTVRYDISV